MNSRRKGKTGELELAHFLSEHGFASRRTSQFCGRPTNGEATDASDVVGLPGFHVECKRVENLNVQKAIEQAVRDAAGRLTPVVFHRRNRKDWLVTIQAADFLKLIKGA
jgi:Holliday junction resolvase